MPISVCDYCGNKEIPLEEAEKKYKYVNNDTRLIDNNFVYRTEETMHCRSVCNDCMANRFDDVFKPRKFNIEDIGG